MTVTVTVTRICNTHGLVLSSLPGEGLLEKERLAALRENRRTGDSNHRALTYGQFHSKRLMSLLLDRTTTIRVSKAIIRRARTNRPEFPLTRRWIARSLTVPH
jgi:hypothetical protein